MDWRCGSSNRAPEALSSNPSSTKKKKKEAEKKSYVKITKIASYRHIHRVTSVSLQKDRNPLNLFGNFSSMV
jgi:hypothetical protein